MLRQHGRAERGAERVPVEGTFVVPNCKPIGDPVGVALNADKGTDCGYEPHQCSFPVSFDVAIVQSISESQRTYAGSDDSAEQFSDPIMLR